MDDPYKDILFSQRFPASTISKLTLGINLIALYPLWSIKERTDCKGMWKLLTVKIVSKQNLSLGKEGNVKKGFKIALSYSAWYKRGQRKTLSSFWDSVITELSKAVFLNLNNFKIPRIQLPSIVPKHHGRMEKRIGELCMPSLFFTCIHFQTCGEWTKILYIYFFSQWQRM